MTARRLNTLASGHPQPVWSPDGGKLAYIFEHANGERLQVWDDVEKRNVFEGQDDSFTDFNHTPIVWSPDSRHLVTLNATPAKAQATPRDAAANDQYKVLIGQRPDPAGVTVLDTTTPDSTALRPRFNRSRMVSVDVATQTERVLASGVMFTSFVVRPDWKEAIAVAILDGDSKAWYAALFRVPLQPRSAGSSGTVVAAGAVDATGDPLQLIGRDIPGGQPLQVSLSPSGKYLAYGTGSYNAVGFDTGGTVPGDVFVVDLLSGTTRNITASLKLPRSPFATEGKFELTSVPPIWTADEKSVLALRSTPRPGMQAPHTDLWRIARHGRSAARIALSEDISIADLAHCGQWFTPCFSGSHGELMARVRIQRVPPASDILAFAAIDPASGVVRLLHRAGPAGATHQEGVTIGETALNIRSRTLVGARGKSFVVGAIESQNQPQELVKVGLASSTQAESLRLINPQRLPPPGRYVRVKWKSHTDAQLYGALRLPFQTGPGERVPVIAIVYPTARLSYSGDGAFDGGLEETFTRLRNFGFATYALDLPADPKAEPGTYCDYSTTEIDSALHAAAATGLVDVQRAGIIGVSGGGQLVTCVIARTTGFLAAVSVSGVPDRLAPLNGGMTLLQIPGYPWQFPMAYVNADPVFRIDRISTPLALIYGKEDVLSSQNIDFYQWLAIAAKPVQLVGYDRAGHSEMMFMDDFWQRVSAWFSKYLVSTAGQQTDAAIE